MPAHTGVDTLTEALVEHVQTRRAHRERVDAILDAARSQADEARRTGSRLQAVRSARRTFGALREQQKMRPAFDAAPFVGLVAACRGTDPEAVERDLYRAVWQLEFLAGTDGAGPGADTGPPMPDRVLAQAARLLAGWLLEPADGPLHTRLRQTERLWLALERGRILALSPGPLMLTPRRWMARTERREALMGLPEARRDLVREWERALGA